MKKFLAVLLSAVSVFAFAACSGDPSDEPGGGKDMTLAENYDFGDPSTWAGTSLQRLNLGDAEFDVFPEDHFYDWGQSVMYDSQEGIYTNAAFEAGAGNATDYVNTLTDGYVGTIQGGKTLSDSFFTAAAYKGAVSASDDWTAGWTL